MAVLTERNLARAVRCLSCSPQRLCVQVEQQYLVTSMTAQHAVLLAVIREHMRAEREFKVMCFFTTARITQFYCALFNALGVPVLEMHSRKSQAQRTRAADQFRASKRCIMFSSDVSARGVDYPDVSLVIQVSSVNKSLACSIADVQQQLRPCVGRRLSSKRNAFSSTCFQATCSVQGGNTARCLDHA